MSDSKDDLLLKQQEEIKKLKKELKEASKPSSLFSTLKKSVKRNVHEFFNREDKMKSMDAELKELRKKLEKTEEEKEKQDAIIFAQEHLRKEDGKSGGKEFEDYGLAQTPEEALKKYFGPCDISAYLKSMQPEEKPAQSHDEEQKQPKEQDAQGKKPDQTSKPQEDKPEPPKEAGTQKAQSDTQQSKQALIIEPPTSVTATAPAAVVRRKDDIKKQVQPQVEKKEEKPDSVQQTQRALQNVTKVQSVQQNDQKDKQQPAETPKTDPQDQTADNKKGTLPYKGQQKNIQQANKKKNKKDKRPQKNVNTTPANNTPNKQAPKIDMGAYMDFDDDRSTAAKKSDETKIANTASVSETKIQEEQKNETNQSIEKTLTSTSSEKRVQKEESKPGKGNVTEKSVQNNFEAVDISEAVPEKPEQALSELINEERAETPKTDPEERPEIYLGFVEEPEITPPPMNFGSVFDDDDDFDDDIL